MRIPEGLAQELRSAMCAETYGRVIHILDRWVETACAPMVVSGLDRLAGRPEQLADIRQAREDVALTTLGHLITRGERSGHIVDRVDSQSWDQEARVTMFSVTVLRNNPR